MKFILNIGIIISLSLVASTSFAKKRTVGDLLKKIEKKAKYVKIKKNKSSLPSFSNISRSAKKVNLYKIKPPSSNKLYYAEGTDESALEKIIDEEIAQLYKLTKRFKKSSRRGELWLRLAELYVDKAKIIELKLQRDYDAKIQRNAKNKIRKAPKKINLRAANNYNKKAIQLYEWFLRDYPKDKKVPQALYFLGYNHVELGNLKKGKNFYLQLSKNHPKSSYVNEANFSVGEYYFDKGQWKTALPYYSKVTVNKRARLFSFALYKRAWCKYKTGKVKSGLTDLERVIYEGRKSKARKNSKKAVSRIRLASEAVKDIVVFYAEVGDPKTSREYFERVVGRKSAPGNIKKLAFYYLDIGKKKSAKYTFRRLIDDDPMSPKAFDYQYQIIKMYSAAGNDKIFRQELLTWSESYGQESEWREANKGDSKLITKADSLMESTLRNYTLQQHQSAQNSKSKLARDKAQRAYGMYFSTFKRSKKLDEMHFFYAELLYDMKKYKKAGYHYNWIAENAPKSKYYEKSILNSLLALEKKLPKENKINNSKDLEPREFDSATRLFEKVAKRYSREFPNGENATPILYRLGSLKYGHNQYDEALEYLFRVVKKEPKSEYAKYSANMILDIYGKRKDYAGLNKAAESLLSISGLSSGTTATKIKGIKERSEFKQLEAIDKSGDPLRSAKAYQAYAAKNKTTLGATALFNAGIKFEKANKPLSAIGVYTGLVVNSLSSADDKKEARKFLGLLYEKTGQYPLAASSYERYAKKYPKDSKAPDFYYNAAVIQDGLRQYSNALKNYQAYYDRSKLREKREVLFRIAKIWEKRRNYTRAIAYYNKYISSGTPNSAKVMDSVYKIAKLNEKRGRKKSADEWFKKVYYTYNSYKAKGLKIGASYAAEADFRSVKKNYYDKLKAIRVPRNSQKQSAAIQKKISMLNRLKDKLKKVVAYDDGPYVVASLTLQGQAFQHVANAIYKAPPPPSLKGKDLEAYKQGINGLAGPFKKNAIDIYKKSVERGFDLEAYNNWLKIAQTELKKLGDETYKHYDFMPMPATVLERKGIKGDLGAKDMNTVHAVVKKKLEKDSEDIVALNALAVAYIDKKEYGMGRIILQRALKAHPNSSLLHNNIAVSYLKEGDQREALIEFKKSQQGDGDIKVGQANIASVYTEYGDYKRAISPLEEAYSEVKSDLSRGSIEAVTIANNYALSLIGVDQADDARKVLSHAANSGKREVSILYNYAVLLVDVLKEKKEAYKIISKLKFTTDDRKILKKVSALEKRIK